MKRILAVIAVVLLSVACGGTNERTEVKTRPFPLPEAPGMITDMLERQEYLTAHYWDSFFEGDWPTDSAYVLGVPDVEVEKNISAFIMLLDGLPMDTARENVARLFSKIEDKQAADTSSLVYLRMTELVSKYLYDPNSPLRSEDYYLPFVEGMAKSRFTDDLRRAGYEFELSKCLLNPYGSKVPDFGFRDLSGRSSTLYAVDADYTMLFFSNPGCNYCRSIIDEIGSRPYVDDLIADGSLAIVNIYIDGEVDKWREYAPIYPENWINAYDYAQSINNEGLYFVRAIPSIYLLDGEKRVIYKDAPLEKVLAFFDNLTGYNNY